MAYAGAPVSKMAGHRFWVATPAEPATLLRTRKTSEGDVGDLATVAHRHKGMWHRRTGFA
jgi:hypothetical protein